MYIQCRILVSFHFSSHYNFFSLFSLLSLSIFPSSSIFNIVYENIFLPACQNFTSTAAVASPACLGLSEFVIPYAFQYTDIAIVLLYIDILIYNSLFCIFLIPSPCHFCLTFIITQYCAGEKRRRKKNACGMLLLYIHSA